jgi:hypothetical protein
MQGEANEGRPEAFEIGREMADAVAADERHRKAAAWRGRSPLDGVRYEAEAGEHDLLRFVESAVDDRVGQVVADFRSADGQARAAMRAACTLDDFYTLIAFGRRSAVRALRSGSGDPARSGLAALALVDSERVALRDVVVGVGLVSYALRELGGGVDGLLNDMIPLATPQVAEVFARFIHPAADDLDPGTWGFKQVTTADGPALVDTGIEYFDPGHDLLGIGLRIAGLVDRDEYRTYSVRIGERLPVVWLPGAGRAAANVVLDRCTGCVLLNARLQADVEHAASQQFTVFLMEADGEADAELLESWVAGGSHASLGVRRGSLFCLVVARSLVADVPSYESTASLERFSTPLLDALRR